MFLFGHYLVLYGVWRVFFWIYGRKLVTYIDFTYLSTLGCISEDQWILFILLGIPFAISFRVPSWWPSRVSPIHRVSVQRPPHLTLGLAWHGPSRNPLTVIAFLRDGYQESFGKGQDYPCQGPWLCLGKSGMFCGSSQRHWPRIGNIEQFLEL